MYSESILTANLQALERAQGRRPALARLDPSRVRAIPDMTGGLRLEMASPAGEWVSHEGPVATQFPRQVFVIGPALGAVLDAIEGAGAPTRVVALEPDAGTAVLLLARRDWTRWIEQGRLRLLTGPDYRGASSCAKDVDVSEPPSVLVSPQLAEHRPAEVAAAQAIASRLIADAEKNANARKRFAGRYVLQSLGNLAVIGREGNVASLDGLFTGHPAVVVGAGPSLDDNLPALRALAGRAVIVAADTTLRPLLAGGVRPHIMTGVDPAELNAQHLADVEGLDDIWLAAEGSLHPSAFVGFAGRIFTFKVSDHEPWPWLRTLGCDRGLLRTWGSVVTSAFDLSRRMGCDPIVFAGLDLSYPVPRPYCANTIYDQTWRDATERYGCTREQLVEDYFARVGDLRRPDIAGAPVLTSPHLVSFRDWLVEQTAGDASRRFINVTGAGILHGGRIVQSTLDAVLCEAPVIDVELRERLRAAHANDPDRRGDLHAAVEEMLADPAAPRAAAQVERWIDFSAGSVTPSDIKSQLESAAVSLRR